MTTFVLVCVFGISASTPQVVHVTPIPRALYRAIWVDQADSDSSRRAHEQCRKVHGKSPDLAWIEVR